ncbi:protein kinase family protein [Bacillus timonensis]|nr:protein kinase family protein [Bacillus timonensis]
MMNNILKNQACKVSPGTVIHGKWHKHAYKIVKPLGYGANGIVYLAEGKQDLVALKISDNSISITSEVNVLKHFSKVQGSALGPSLLDVDDWIRPGFLEPIPFYVMEFIDGIDLLSFILNRGKEWTGILCLQLLSDLERLHQKGWVFGDLKPDNLLVVGNPPKIRCIDVGGTTIQGRAIKEFTEFFDRGYWGIGSRKAEPSYDLFAVAMIMINAQFPKRFSKTGEGKEQLKHLVNSNDELKKYQTVLLNAVEGKYQSALQMRSDLLVAMTDAQFPPSRKKSITKSTFTSAKSGKSHSKKRAVTKKKKGGITETVLILILVTLAYVLYVYSELL